MKQRIWSLDIVIAATVLVILALAVMSAKGQRDHTPTVSAQKIGQQKLTNRHGGLDEGLGSLARPDLDMQRSTAVVEETSGKQSGERTALGLENEDKESDHLCADCPCNRQHHTRCNQVCQLRPDGKRYRRMTVRERAECVLRCIVRK